VLAGSIEPRLLVNPPDKMSSTTTPDEIPWWRGNAFTSSGVIGRYTTKCPDAIYLAK